MINLYENSLSLSDRYEAFLLDAYGVFWGGNRLGVLPGTKERMEALMAKGKILGILSNSTQLVESEKIKLAKHGLIEGRHYHFLITSGEVSKQTFIQDTLPFETPKKKFWVFGSPHESYSSPSTLFQGSQFTQTEDIQQADFIYIAIPHISGEDQTETEMFREEIKKVISSKLPMLCTNPDLFAHEGNPPKAVVRQGSIAKLYQELGGVVFYIGKPYPHVYEVAMKSFAHFNINDKTKVIMIGDTPETDIQGARKFGLASALTTKTGIMAERIAHSDLEQAITKLSANERPDFFIKSL